MHARRCIVQVAIALLTVFLTHVEAAGPTGTIAFVRDSDVYTVRLDGTNLDRLTTDGRNALPLWSRDGRHIAFTKSWVSKDGNQAGACLWVSASDGTSTRRLTKEEGLSAIYPVAWLPDVSGLLVSRHYLDSDVSETLEVMTLDGKPFRHLQSWMRTSKQSGFIQQIRDEKHFTSGVAGDFTRSGDLVFTAATAWFVDAPRLDLYRMHADGTGLRRLTVEPHWFVDCLRVNPVSGVILTSESSVGDVQEPSVRLRGKDGKVLKELLTVGQSSFGGIDWSPGGDYIIYQTTDAGYPRSELPSDFASMSRHSSIWIMKADGSGRKRIASNACHPNWK